jgi:hypothetical protein
MMRTPAESEHPTVPRTTFLRQMALISAAVMAVLLPLAYLLLRDLMQFSRAESLGTVAVILAVFTASVVRSVRRGLARYGR